MTIVNSQEQTTRPHLAEAMLQMEINVSIQPLIGAKLSHVNGLLPRPFLYSGSDTALFPLCK
jgi:hypothetical protein